MKAPKKKPPHRVFEEALRAQAAQTPANIKPKKPVKQKGRAK